MSSKFTDSDWEKKLPSNVYYVTRKKGTEEPYSGKYDKHFEDGEYKCACCESLLFIWNDAIVSCPIHRIGRSDDKFDSGCGWPAFSRVAGASTSGDDSTTNIKRYTDSSYGMQRVEVACKLCDAHLGHVFDDGPPPTNLRYCINSASLFFVPKDSS